MPSFMAFFKRKEKVPAEVQRLDWKLLERGAVALYHKSSVLSADLAWFRQQNYTIHELNGVGWTSPADFHTELHLGSTALCLSHGVHFHLCHSFRVSAG